MRLALELLFEKSLSAFQDSGDEFHHGQFMAYDNCLRLLEKESGYLQEEMKKFNLGFSYRKDEAET